MTSGKMKDGLRQNACIPMISPYGTAAEISPSLLDITGDDAIIDWVRVELRDNHNPSILIAAQDALLQGDGDVVATDGISPLRFTGIASNGYFVVLRHRNHLSVMSSNAVLLSKTLGDTIDFTQGAAYGIVPMHSFSNLSLIHI